MTDLRDKIARALFAWDVEHHAEPKPTWDQMRHVFESGADAVLAVVGELEQEADRIFKHLQKEQEARVRTSKVFEQMRNERTAAIDKQYKLSAELEALEKNLDGIRADAWDQGLAAGLRECNDKTCGVVNNPVPNPYRKAEQ